MVLKRHINYFVIIIFNNISCLPKYYEYMNRYESFYFPINIVNLTCKYNILHALAVTYEYYYFIKINNLYLNIVHVRLRRMYNYETQL